MRLVVMICLQGIGIKRMKLIDVQSILDDTLGALLASEGNLLAGLGQATNMVRRNGGGILLGGRGDVRDGSSEGEDRGGRSRCDGCTVISMTCPGIIDYVLLPLVYFTYLGGP